MSAQFGNLCPLPGGEFQAANNCVACNGLSESALNHEIELLSRLLPGDPTMSEGEVAALLKVRLKTLQNRRLAKPETVPPFIQLPGRRGVVYMRHEVIRYVAIQILTSRGRRIHRL